MDISSSQQQQQWWRHSVMMMMMMMRGESDGTVTTVRPHTADC